MIPAVPKSPWSLSLLASSTWLQLWSFHSALTPPEGHISRLAPVITFVLVRVGPSYEFGCKPGSPSPFLDVGSDHANSAPVRPLKCSQYKATITEENENALTAAIASGATSGESLLECPGFKFDRRLLVPFDSVHSWVEELNQVR